MNRETTLRYSDTLVVVDRSQRRRWVIIAAGIIAVLAIALAVMMMSGGDEKAAPAGAGGGRGGQIPTVTVVVPGRSEVARTVTASGALAARRDQPVGIAGQGGRVTRVLVDAGNWVRAGQVLATVDRSVQSQQAAQLAAQIGQLNVLAPTSGLVLARSVEVGQIVGAGSPALFRLAAGGDMEMRAQISQQDLAFVRAGMPATVTPIGLDRSFTGTVWQVAPVIDPQSRQGEVRISIPYDPAIRPGGFAEAKIGAGGTTAPLLPQSAVLSDEKGNYVYIINAKNEVERRDVKIGNVDDNGVTIATGLSGQEAVVLSAGPFLNPGQKVSPKRQAAR